MLLNDSSKEFQVALQKALKPLQVKAMWMKAEATTASSEDSQKRLDEDMDRLFAGESGKKDGSSPLAS